MSLTRTTARAGRSDPRSFRHAPCERNAIAQATTGETKVRCDEGATRPLGGPRHGPRARLRVRHASRAIWARAPACSAAQAGSDPSDVSCINPSTPKPTRLQGDASLQEWPQSGCEWVYSRRERALLRITVNRRWLARERGGATLRAFARDPHYRLGRLRQTGIDKRWY